MVSNNHWGGIIVIIQYYSDDDDKNDKDDVHRWCVKSGYDDRTGKNVRTASTKVTKFGEMV